MLINAIIHYKEEVDKGNDAIIVDLIDDNIYEWNVKFNGKKFPAQSKICEDLMRLDNLYGVGYIELRVSFLMELYPFYPPSIRLVRPRLENYMFGRIVTMKELQLSQWNPGIFFVFFKKKFFFCMCVQYLLYDV